VVPGFRFRHPRSEGFPTGSTNKPFPRLVQVEDLKNQKSRTRRRRRRRHQHKISEKLKFGMHKTSYNNTIKYLTLFKITLFFNLQTPPYSVRSNFWNASKRMERKCISKMFTIFQKQIETARAHCRYISRLRSGQKSISSVRSGDQDCPTSSFLSAYLHSTLHHTIFMRHFYHRVQNFRLNLTLTMTNQFRHNAYLQLKKNPQFSPSAQVLSASYHYSSLHIASLYLFQILMF